MDDGTFDDAFVGDLDRLLRWRRDVRRFRREPLEPHLLPDILDAAELAPSVGNSQPWRWVEVRSTEARQSVRDSFTRCNADALAEYEGERAALYARLKLEGLREAPKPAKDYHQPVQGNLGRYQTSRTEDDYTQSGIADDDEYDDEYDDEGEFERAELRHPTFARHPQQQQQPHQDEGGSQHDFCVKQQVEVTQEQPLPVERPHRLAARAHASGSVRAPS